MIKLALLGKDIQHSKSPEMYKKIYDQEIDYQFIDKQSPEEIPDLEEIFSNVNGLSITAPYKEHFLSSVSMKDDIEKLHAINCIKFDGKKFCATNTDYTAMSEILNELDFRDKEIFILGSGAMARITKIFLESEGKIFSQISRREDGDITSVNLIERKQTDQDTLVINSCARSYEFSGSLPINTTFWDYNYSHNHNKEYVEKIAEYVDGIDLLFRQAIHATHFWNLNS